MDFLLSVASVAYLIISRGPSRFANLSKKRFCLTTVLFQIANGGSNCESAEAELKINSIEICKLFECLFRIVFSTSENILEIKEEHVHITFSGENTGERGFTWCVEPPRECLIDFSLLQSLLHVTLQRNWETVARVWPLTLPPPPSKPPLLPGPTAFRIQNPKYYELFPRRRKVHVHNPRKVTRYIVSYHCEVSNPQPSIPSVQVPPLGHPASIKMQSAGSVLRTTHVGTLLHRLYFKSFKCPLIVIITKIL